MPIFNKIKRADCPIRVYQFFSVSGNMKQTLRRGYPALYYSILLYFILSIAIVISWAYFARICCYYASILHALCFCFPSSYYSNYFAGKIDASLATMKNRWKWKKNRLIPRFINLRMIIALCSGMLHQSMWYVHSYSYTFSVQSYTRTETYSS